MFRAKIQNLVTFCAIFLLTFNHVCGYRILGIFPHVGKSHSYAFIPLLKELAEKGHEVTVISHFPIENPPKNYKDISLKGSLELWDASFDMEFFNYPFGTEFIVRHIMSMNGLFQTGLLACKAMIENAEVKELTEGQFDLAIIEQFNSDCGLGIIHKLKLPFIGITSHVLMPWTYERMGIIENPSYVPSHFLPYGRNPGLIGSIESIFLSTWYKNFYYFFLQLPERQILLEHYDKDIPPLEDIARNMSMVMIYTFFPLIGAVPLAPNTVEIGGIHLQKLKPLDKEFETYLNSSKNGVIVFSMGSMLRASSWTPDRLLAFQESFNELSDYDVLWKWANDTMENKPNNVKLVKWLPQYEILNHWNVKVFITHSGMLGLSESIQSGVPVVTIPIFGDQFCNAASARDSGVGAYLDYKEINKETVLRAIKSMLKPEVQERSDKLAAIWKDRPLSALDTAVYWVEHVARHGGEHLRPSSMDLPLYRYLLLDVAAIVLIIFILNVYLIIFLCRVLWKCCTKKSKKD